MARTHNESTSSIVSCAVSSRAISTSAITTSGITASAVTRDAIAGLIPPPLVQFDQKRLPNQVLGQQITKLYHPRYHHW